MSKIEGKITVAEAISELLYRYDSVIVPKFGGFVKEYRASTFDYVQGKISPPSSSISFNENLKVDDGLLIDYYRKENKLSLQQAQEEIVAFSKKAKVTLSNREVVSLPKVGRLLKDYENQTKFISQNHNFNTDTYGLSEVRYYPILREIPKNEENMPTTAATAAAIPGITKKKGRKSQKIAKVAIPIAVFLMLLSAFFVFRNFGTNDELANTNPQTEVETDNKDDPTKMPVNIKPPTKEEPDTGESGNTGTEAEEGMPENESAGGGASSTEGFAGMEEPATAQSNAPEESEPEINEPASVNPPKYSDDIIYVGLFSKQRGVDQFTALIVENDWVPYTKVMRNGNTKVGLRIPYGVDPEELLSEVRIRIEKNAYY